MIAHLASAEYYGRDAAERGARYARARFEDIHADILDHLPPPGSDVLDVGAGSGRDAAALAARGYRVVAVEPAQALADWGRARYADQEIIWIDDALPALSVVSAMPRRYAFILCSAVLMHVVAEALDRSVATLAALLTPRGHLAMSVRDRGAQDPAAIFHNHSEDAILEAARRSNLALVHQRENPDQLARPDFIWRAYLFRKID
jgi:2-polyprenyl-3-methyl-5-hydroxy-6-metoxy-1,4-benzoquinol methylase